MTLLKFFKHPVQVLIEPYSITGLGRDFPLLFWRLYASLRCRNTLTGFQVESSTETSNQNAVEFFRDHLLNNLLPFWAKNSVDRKHGGYITHLDRQGSPYNSTERVSAMQARLVFAFSAGHQIAPALGYLELAQHGVNFLINKAWDQRYGGWFAQISADGTVQDPKKRVFDQAYLLIGLSDYYRLHRDGNVLDFILETYDKLEYYAWDQNYLGYHEVFQDDWGIISDRKTICIQLDMLRAVLSLWKATSNNRFVQRAFQLGDLVVGKMCDPILGCTLEIFHSDWRYAPARMRDRVWSGHILKGAWLLLELDAITPNARYVDTAVRMVDYCLHYAWDNPNGGFYQFLYRTGRLASSTKLWWSQTEGLNALLALYRKTGEPRYWHAFTRLVEFSFQNFVDWEYGEWYTSCTEDGKPSDDRKGGDTKSAYHTVQTCIMLAKGLETLAG